MKLKEKIKRGICVFVSLMMLASIIPPMSARADEEGEPDGEESMYLDETWVNSGSRVTKTVERTGTSVGRWTVYESMNGKKADGMALWNAIQSGGLSYSDVLGGGVWNRPGTRVTIDGWTKPEGYDDSEEPEKGMHYCTKKRYGEISVGYWKVMHAPAKCIHEEYFQSNYFGMSTATAPCGMAYYSGWWPYCADCGKVIMPVHIYMTKEAAETVKSVNVNYDYYYICPLCTHVENSWEAKPHECTTISWNRYKVVYEGNGPDGKKPFGAMVESFHMYNNETEYEGETVDYPNHLNMNSYLVPSYTFMGWATSPEGSVNLNEGAYAELNEYGLIADGAEILNLTEYDENDPDGRGVITLYAQWEKTESTLEIDPTGDGRYMDATYMGTNEITVITQEGDSTYFVDSKNRLTCPEGYTISYVTGEGTPCPADDADYELSSWILKPPSEGDAKRHGRFDASTETYTFSGENHIVDRLSAAYAIAPVILPESICEDMSFGGWYTDPDYNVAGFAGMPPAGRRYIQEGNMAAG